MLEITSTTEQSKDLATFAREHDVYSWASIVVLVDRAIENGVPKISDFGDENDLIRRGDALKAIRKACISAHLPFDSATPEGQRVMEALYAVWKVPKEGKTHDSI